MFRGTRGIALCSVLVLLPTQVGAATIVLKDGKTVEGEIRGNIALNAGKSGYLLVDGGDILRIDELGLHLRAGTRAGNCIGVPESVPAVEVLEQIAEYSKYGFYMTIFQGKKVPITGLVATVETVYSGRLLGEFRLAQGKGQLLTILSVTTQAGPVQVKLAELVPFSQPPKAKQ